MSNEYRKCAFDYQWQKLYSSIFTQHISETRRFVNQSWAEALIPERILLMPEVDHILPALVAQLTNADGEVMVTSPITEPKFDEAFLVISSASALMNVFYEPSICNFDHVMFTRSGNWGMYFCEELDYSAIGGERSFMRSLLVALGGEEAIKSRFLDYLWNQSDVDDTTKHLLLSSVGWNGER